MELDDELMTVIKIGGACVEQADGIDELAAYVAGLRASGRGVVVVHGGGGEISALEEELGEPHRDLDGLRVTSARGIEITTMVLCGLVNKRVVARFVKAGLAALGLSGVDLGLLASEPLDAERFGRVGRGPVVAADRLRALLDAGCVPVIAPVSIDPDGGLLNVNADTAAIAVARALAADSLEFMSDVPGVRTSADSDATARRLRSADVDDLLADATVVSGGMIPKLTSALEALEAGIARVRVGDLAGMCTDEATELVA